MIVYDENLEMHEVAEAVITAMIDKGLAWTDGERTRALLADLDLHIKHPELAICDFCSGKPVTHDVECEDFVIAESLSTPNGSAPYESVGGWAACATCGRLLEQGDRNGLLWHCTRHLEPIAALALTIVHKRFWKHFKSVRRL